MIWFLEASPHVRKMNTGSRQAGINKTKKRSSETKGNNQGKPPKILVACYECPAQSGYPPNVIVQGKDRKAVCKNGHIIDCSGGCKLAGIYV